ncbi:MAG: pyruvate dehydrogenase complex dihydrolipoamide acetyltransferase [Rhodospirillaceae bacterium]|nr:pyruvate dehydrogenase complex dihydrolipoamide acetyltransferase [Rhodospirillaceae bacterium]|tara:strand:+ start:970 stop:2274 length:1305 start_codon:yes stop_codon:yes gene_type:complete
MPIEILMPALSPTMTEGTLVSWLKNEGDQVNPGDIIAEIETDKATMEVEAVEEGLLGKIVVSAGTEGVSVNTVIAFLLEEGEDASSISIPLDSSSSKERSVPLVRPDSSSGVEANQRKELAGLSETTVRDVPNDVSKLEPLAVSNRITASPLARRMAEHSGIDLAKISGSGPNGRIVKADIDRIISGNGAPLQQVRSTRDINEPSLTPEYDAVPNSSMRKVIAQRLSESKQSAPHFYMTVDCEIDALFDVRQKLNAKVEDAKISVNDFVIRASALAMKRVPAANASWTEEETRIYKTVDISVAVAVEGGLLTPVVRDAGSKGLKQISSEMKDLAARARDGRLAPEEYQGGTFSISNLGMYGVKEFAAVVNPPQGAILAVGAGEQRPVIRDGAVTVATVMSCTLSVDHRVIDGAVGAEFLDTFKRLIEDPMTMLL